MSVPSTDRLTEALATVQDPEIKRPITELGMVDHLEVDEAGLVRVTVLLTVSGCPMKDTIDRDVRAPSAPSTASPASSSPSAR